MLQGIREISRTYLGKLEVDVNNGGQAQADKDKVIFVADGRKRQGGRRICGDGDRVVGTVRDRTAFGSQVRRPDFRDVAEGGVVDEHGPHEDIDIEHGRGSIEARRVCGSQVESLEHSLGHEDYVNGHAANH